MSTASAGSSAASAITHTQGEPYLLLAPVRGTQQKHNRVRRWWRANFLFHSTPEKKK